MVIAAMASTIGTARGNTHGSWRPLAFNVVSMPSILTVSCSISTVATGLNATRKKISCPLLIPLDSSGVVGSCFYPPIIVVEHIVLL